MARKVTLVEDWKQSWKFASIRFNIAGFLLMLVDVIGATWVGLPSSIQDKIPHASTIAMVLFGLGAIGRILKTQEKQDGSQ